MKYLKFILLGMVFGIILTKGEIVSWYRIYEMFNFQSFHMYGVIGSAVTICAIAVAVFKKVKVGFGGVEIKLPSKTNGWKSSLFGGTIFGLGWAMVGACPGPLFILIGNGFMAAGVALLGALLGTFVYGMVRSKLPH